MTTPTPPSADYSDQRGLFDPSQVSATVTMIGCGGIGASVLPVLLTLGFKSFRLWDGDFVEARNVTTNLTFRAQDIGRRKVERVAEYLLEHGGPSIVVDARREAYSGQEPLSGIVISGVDSMSVRQMLWNNHLADNTDVIFYMDGRIGGRALSLYCLEPFDDVQAELYTKHYLYSDKEAAPLACTVRTIVHPAVTLGCLMAEYLSRWSRGEIDQIPFATDIDFASPGLFLRTIPKQSDE